MFWVTPYRQCNFPCRLLHLSIDKGEVDFSDCSYLELMAEASVGNATLCNDHGTGGLFIKAVDNARTNPVADSCKIRAMKKQGIHKGSALVTGPGVYHESGGFIQNDDILVFVENRKGNRFRLAYDRFWRRDFRLDKISGLGQISRFLDVSIDRYVTGTNQPVRMGAGESGQMRDNGRIESASSL
jgi:hypothetical protein